MKIGILSMQKVLNYGSFLQALSLKIQFERRGHEVYFIDIEQGRQIVSPVSQTTSILSKFDRYFIKRIENYLLDAKMTKIHVDDYTKFLEVDKKPIDNRYDLAVIGSDEVFNATTPSKWGFSTQLFGKIENAKRVATFAASCGATTYETAKKYNIISDIKNSMLNLFAISVRDENTYDFVNRIDGREPCIHVDPVFLTDYEIYIPQIKVKRPYVLVYAYGNRISDEDEINVIKKYAKDNGLDILCVGMQQRWCKKNIAASAFELLAYVKNAECIITDTFHGTVFSIKYNKRFVSFIRESNKNKLEGLLNQFMLSSRIVNQPEKMPEIMCKEIDYRKVNVIISNEQKKASEYLDMICEVR